MYKENDMYAQGPAWIPCQLETRGNNRARILKCSCGDAQEIKQLLQT